MDPLLQNIALLLMASFPVCIFAYPNGQVTSVCDTMLPQHSAGAQTSSSPYTLSLDKYTYSAGDTIKVTLSGSQFKGFLLQARSGSSTVPVGSFVTNNSNAQTLTCTTAASAVSHTSGSGKTSIDVTWVAPASNITDIQIRATVVQTMQVFWTNVMSAKIAYVPILTTPATTVGNPSNTSTTVKITTANTTTSSTVRTPSSTNTTVKNGTINTSTTVGSPFTTSSAVKNVTMNSTVSTTVGKASSTNTTVKNGTIYTSTTVGSPSTTTMTVKNSTMNSTVSTTVGKSSSTNTTVKNGTINTSTSTTVKTAATNKVTVKTTTVQNTAPPSGVQRTWTLLGLLLSCGILIASFLV